ncbi:MAG: hypothetical protein ACFFD4_21665 [Candidatus Odinarchaeota archaeon]
MSIAGKNELLFQKRGINYHNLPNWQKRGVGLYWKYMRNRRSTP